MDFVGRIVTALLRLHPWHTLVVHFPIALSTVGLVFVLLALWRRSELLERFAFLNLALVAAGTALAGLAGIRDHLVRFGGHTPYVNVKIFLGASLLLLAATTAALRRTRRDLLWKPSTRILYVAAYVSGFLLAAVLGFVGGAIVYGF